MPSCDRTKLRDKTIFLDFAVEIVKRKDPKDGFQILLRRWLVERVSGWMTRWRRLMCNYEKRLNIAEAMIHVALAPLSPSAGLPIADVSDGR